MQILKPKGVIDHNYKSHCSLIDRLIFKYVLGKDQEREDQVKRKAAEVH